MPSQALPRRPGRSLAARGRVTSIQSRGKTRPRSSSRASAPFARSISPRATSDSTCSGSLRSGTRSRTASSVQRYIRVSAASTAAWSSSANSTNASPERKSDSQTVRPERFASSIRGSSVVRARPVLPRPASTKERRRKRRPRARALELSDCGASVLDEPLGQVPPSGAELGESEMREALRHPPLLTTHPVPLGFDSVPVARRRGRRSR